MPPTPRIHIILDIKLIICPDYYRYDVRTALDYFNDLIQHINAFENNGDNLSFVFTNELKRFILNSFPWNIDIETNPELADLFNAVLPVLSTALIRQPLTQPVVIRPEISISREYINHVILQEWSKLVASASDCWSDAEHHEYIKIASTGNNNEGEFCYFQLFINETMISLIEVFDVEHWTDMLRWANQCLPRVGNYAYEPFNTRQQSPNFQKGITTTGGQGPKDIRGNIWKWDLLHKNHWDVVTSREVRVAKISPDGRILN